MSVRVLHVGKFYPPFAGGMEHFLADLLPPLQQQGIHCAALVHASPGSEDNAQSTQRPIPIYHAPCSGRLLYAPISPSFPRWLHRAIRAFQPNLLHVHLPNTSAFAAFIVPAARRLPWIVHWHADVVASQLDRRLALAYQLYRPFEQRFLTASAAIIATSPPYLAASAALAPWRERCSIIPLGLDPQRIAAPNAAAQQRAAQLWGEQRKFRILAIGRLTYYKGHDVLIRAAAAVPDSRILIVGTGEQRPRLEKLLADLQLQERVQLPGFQSEDDLHALLASCDVLCLPSLERTEAFGLVLLEAMRFGKPVVVSDIPGSGPGWVVREAGHGRCVAPGDASALTMALRELQTQPAQRLALGAQGSRALHEKFGIAPVASAVAALYRHILGTH